MKSIYVVMHHRKDNIEGLACQLVRALTEAGITVFAEPWLFHRLEHRKDITLVQGNPTYCEAVLSVGGDGTFLRANTIAVAYGLPILGINLGTVGFLAEVEWEQLAEACHSLAMEEYNIRARMMLSATLESFTDDSQKSWYALNDVVLSRGRYSRLISVNAAVNGQDVGRFIADGLIVSTPTGSTGYSLSAGGPIVHPDVECILLTPICAHSLQHRPVVAAPDHHVELMLDETYTTRGVQCSVDGQEVVILQPGERLLVTRAPFDAMLIETQPQSFFTTIRLKLAEWSR